MIPTCIPTSAVQKRIFSLAGLLHGFALNLIKPAIKVAPAGLSRPVRERETDSPTVITSLNEARLSVIEHLNEARLTVIRVSNEAQSGVAAGESELAILKMVSIAEAQPLKSYGAESLKSEKKDLPLFRFTVYVNSAPAKSGAGIGVPEIITATPDAPSVFFCVVHSVHPFFCVAVIIRAAHEIMVGCVGASFEAPVSVVSGYANPIQSTTLEIGVSGGGYPNHTSEAALWLLPPPKNHLLSGAFTLASNLAISLLPLALSPKPDLFCLIARACSLLASVQEAHMLNQFTVLGYGTNKRGLTVGINYQITSDSTAKATAHAMLQAQRNGLTRITITRVMGAKA